MGDIRFDNGLNTNVGIENEHANAGATASSDGALHASESGATYDGSAWADVSHSATLPETPEMPEAAAQAAATVDATVNDATAHADATLEAVGGAPDLPDVGGSVDGALSGGADATVDGGSVGLDGMLDGWLDVMGDLVVQFSGSLSGLFGF